MSDTLRKYYLDWPHEISLETYSRCNASCAFCPYTTLDRIGERMPDELIDAIIEELKDHPWPFMISPFKVNEPFLDKRLLPLCRRINAELPNAVLRLFTNGSALTRKHLDGVASLVRVKHLWISLNDHRPETYKSLMGLDFERTAANLDMLHGMIEAGEFAHPVTVSKVRKALELDEDDRAFWAYVAERWPRFEVHLIKPDGWLGDIPLGSDEIPDAGCSRWFELSVMANGKVSLCCMDGAGKHSIGDIRDGVFNVYNAPGWRERRVKSMSRRDIHPCSTCSY